MSEQVWMELFDQCANELQAPLEPLVVYRLFGLTAARMFSMWWRGRVKMEV